MHIAKDLAQKLKEQKLTCIDVNDKKMQTRLSFYGVGYCQKNKLLHHKSENSLSVTIRYKDAKVYQAYVTKLNK